MDNISQIDFPSKFSAVFSAGLAEGVSFRETIAIEGLGEKTLVLSLIDKPRIGTVTFQPFAGHVAVEIQRIVAQRAGGKIVTFPPFKSNAAFLEGNLHIFDSDRPEITIEVTDPQAEELILNVIYLACGSNVRALLAERKQDAFDSSVAACGSLRTSFHELQVEMLSLKRDLEISKHEQLALERKYQELSEIKQELEFKRRQLDAALAQRDQEVGVLRQQIDEMNLLLGTTATQTGASRTSTLRSQIHELRHQRDITRNALEHSRVHIAHLEEVVKTIADSRSFKVTKPLRWFTEKLRL